MDYQLPKPKNWQDFESLCHKLWRSIWGDRNAQKNGRQGQNQAGVDIFGRPTYSRGFHAVQCKGKDDNYDTDLTTEEIDAECRKAKSFQPKIKNYIIATTRPRDTKIQKYCLDLTERKEYPFPVSVWSWDDIEPEVVARENILRTHYSSFSHITEPSNEFTVDINSTQDKIAAFLTRPIIQGIISSDLLQLIHSLLYELIDNAFLHGRAGNCKIVIKDSVILLIDNGLEFDTRKLADINGRGGVATMLFVMDELRHDFSIDYKRDGGLNITSLYFSEEIIRKPLNDTIEITIADSLGMGRDVARRQARYDYLAIPNYKNHIIINVLDNMFFGRSFAEEYFKRICELLNENQTVSVYLPANARLVESVQEELKDYPIVFIRRT